MASHKSSIVAAAPAKAQVTRLHDVETATILAPPFAFLGPVQAAAGACAGAGTREKTSTLGFCFAGFKSRQSGGAYDGGGEGSNDGDDNGGLHDETN